MFFGGGVDGGWMRARDAGLAGEGDVARYRSRSAPSSPDLPALSLPLRPKLPRLRPGGGVRGGEDRRLKEWVGRASSSSSDGAAKLFSCCMWAPRKNGKSGPADVVKCGCLRGLIGEDWASWRWFVQEVRPEPSTRPAGDERNLFREPVLEVRFSKLLWYVRFRGPLLLPLENIAAAFRGELRRVRVLPRWKSEFALEEEESDRTSPLDSGLRRPSSSCTLGSILSKGRSSQPRSVLNWARASRFWSLRAIWVGPRSDCAGQARGAAEAEEETHLAQFHSLDDLLCHLARLGLPWRAHAVLGGRWSCRKVGGGGRLAGVGEKGGRRREKKEGKRTRMTGLKEGVWRRTNR
jgi:hypothetical protein